MNVEITALKRLLLSFPCVSPSPTQRPDFPTIPPSLFYKHNPNNMGDDVVSESPGRSAVLAAQASLFSPSSWQRSAQELRGYTHSTPSKSSSKKHNKKQGSRKKGSKHEKPSSNQRSSLAYSVPCTSLSEGYCRFFGLQASISFHICCFTAP